MGAGVFGLSIGFAIARRGVRVQVIDPNGAGSGSSGGPVGALAPHVPENWNPKKAFQFDSLVMAAPFWADVSQVSGMSTGYGRLGRLQPILDEKGLELARARCVTAKEFWGDFAEWSVIPAKGAWAPFSTTGHLIYDSLTARIDPKATCSALSQAICVLGGTVMRSGAPQGPVIWATGWTGLRDLSEHLGKTVGTGVKGQAIALGYDAGEMPQIFADGLHIVPHANGTVAIGSTSERQFDDPTSVDAQCDDLYRKAVETCPILADAPVVIRWAGVRPRARSRAPMLGPWPDRPGHFIANGGFKIGFGMAPKVAQVMADLVLNSDDQIPEGFRVTDNL